MSACVMGATCCHSSNVRSSKKGVDSVTPTVAWPGLALPYVVSRPQIIGEDTGASHGRDSGGTNIYILYMIPELL